jgi:hypothetical protein
VEGVANSGEVTYFVGYDDWQFSVWVHNGKYGGKKKKKGPAGGVAHEKHGRGSEHSGAARARKRDKQDTLRQSQGAKRSLAEKASDAWEKIPDEAKKLLNKDDWIAKKIKELRKRR